MTPPSSTTPRSAATPPSSAVRFRPRRTRVVAWAAAAVVLVASIGLAVALGGPVAEGLPTGADGEFFGPADRVGVVGLGVIGAAALLLLTRPLVEADAEGIRVRNIVGGCQVPWGVVRAVRFDHGSSWATLELQDDEVVGILAVQAVDRQHAVTAVRALRALLSGHRQREATR